MIPGHSSRAIERGLAGGFFAATLATTLLVAENSFVPLQRPLTFGLVFWAWYAAFGLAAGLVLGSAAALLARAPAWCARALLAVPAAAILVVALLWNGGTLATVFQLQGPGRYRLLLPVAAAGAALGLAAVAVLPIARRAMLRVVTALILGAGLGALAPAPARTGVATPRVGAQPRLAANAPLLVLIGIDGADWMYMDVLMERGELPNLAALRRRGTSGALATIRPTWSPVVWTTIATGQPPERHGIEEFTTQLVRGVSDPLGHLKRTRGLGAVALRDFLFARGVIFETAAMSSMRRVPAYWNIATAEGATVNVVNWWATWPAEAVRGHVVSERVYYRPIAGPDQGRVPHAVTSPPGLEKTIAALVARPEDVTLEEVRRFTDATPEDLAAMKAGSFPAKSLNHELPYFLAMLRTDARVVERLVDETERGFGTRGDLLLLCRIVDQVCHTSLSHSDLVSEPLGATPEERRKDGRAVTAAYRAADALVGSVVAQFGNGAHVLVVSDHGFRLEDPGDGNPRYYGHGLAPAGIFIGAGPAFEHREVEGLSVYDMLPLMAYLKGFPVADDLQGRLRRDIVSPAFRAAQPLRRVASYGGRSAEGVAAPLGVEPEMIERLRALGYIQ